MQKDYIGDSVYVTIEPHQIILTTENGLGLGFGASNTIYINTDTLNNLLRVLKQHGVIKDDKCSFDRIS